MVILQAGSEKKKAVIMLTLPNLVFICDFMANIFKILFQFICLLFVYILKINQMVHIQER